MPQSKFLTQLNLSSDERLHPPKILGRLKTVNEWASAAIDAVKDNTDFIGALKDLSPWAEAAFSAAKESIGSIKFVVKLFEELTKIQEPEELARLAFTLAYQSAAEKVIETVGAPAQARISGQKLDEAVDDVDFSGLTIANAAGHPFLIKADRVLQHYLPLAGFSQEQVDRIIREIHDAFLPELTNLLSNGKSKEKFEPLSRWLELSSDGRASRAALRRHGEYVSWVFNKAPVLQVEPYALADICIQAECSKLTHRQLRPDKKTGHPQPNPFIDGDVNGGRHKLLETVMSYIADPKFREPIVIQGSAGSGKSTFTLRLADHLRTHNLKPIRIRLRDVVLGKEFYTQMGDALSYEDDAYLNTHDRFQAPQDPLQSGTIFQEELPFFSGRVKLCPYVLILDGWDEISVAVSEGLKQRVRDLLLRVRSELFRPGRPIMRVIFTGRPSDAIDECTEFFRDETPVLTVRTLSPTELPLYADKLRLAMLEKRLSFEGVSDWKFPDETVLRPIFKRYEREFGDSNSPAEAGPELRGRTYVRTGVAAVLGYPLLLHVTFRLLAEPHINPKEVIESPAGLLRKLTDFATAGADLPSDRQKGAKIQSRITGSGLRGLLRQTAAQMTALGQESIAKAELEKRLRTQDLVRQVNEVSKDKLISALLVSFYFKSGNTALGCEFTHKAIREYLFAEEIVEKLKECARSVPSEGLSERPPSQYWQEYDQQDPRHKASTELATLLMPQWLTDEVVAYLGSLLEWEAHRSLSGEKTTEAEGETSPLTPEEWHRLRTLLADLWDWWADGVHLRPQPYDDENSGQLSWRQSLAERLVPRCRPLVRESGGALPEPVRTTALDAHLRDALFRLCAWVHWYAGLYKKEKDKKMAPRRFQRNENGKVRFRPTGANFSYFEFLCARISAAGWRPNGTFPTKVFARGLDLTETLLGEVSFYAADLEGSTFRRTTLSMVNFSEARLINCMFEGGNVIQSFFVLAKLDGASFKGATLFNNVFIGASLVGTNFDEKLKDEAYYGMPSGGYRLPPNNFSGALGIDLGHPRFATSIIRQESSEGKPE